MEAIHLLKAVLCDTGGRVCIAGSDGDRAVIHEALQNLHEQLVNIDQLRAELVECKRERNELVAEVKKFCDDWKFCRGSVRAFQELQIALAKLGADKTGSVS